MPETYICKIATLEEMEQKWDDEIARSGADRANWIAWKAQYIAASRQGQSIPYYGLLNGRIISEATAKLHPAVVQNSAGLVDGQTVYLASFRTLPAYQGQGYFSQLLRFMLADLCRRGYRRATLGVEPSEAKNKAMYAHFGFTEFIKAGSKIAVEYYAKPLA